MANHYLDKTDLPYVTLNSPTSTDPVWQDGENAMVGMDGFSRARPGFSSEAIPGPFSGTIQRIFTWRKWGGSYFGMVSSTDAISSYVYKYEMGVDAAAVLIHTCSTSTTPFDFIVSNNTCFFGNGVDMKKYEGVGTTVYGWGITGPASAPTYTTSAGALTTIAGGDFYFYTFGRASNNHESSPSDASICTGNQVSKKYTVTVSYSADPQVDTIYLYRSVDGGGDDPASARLVTTIPNVVGVGTTTYDDETADTALDDRTAPAFFRNDPPTPCKGFVSHAGRIAGFKDNKVYYSGFEEISFNGGVPEECWPGGLDGNTRPYAQEVFALAELSDGIAVFLASDIHKIEGDSLDTFRFYKLSAHQGALSPACVRSFAGLGVWFDTSSSVWLINGDELSLPIRNTLASVNAATAQIALHFQGQYRWVCVLDTENSVMYVMDSDSHKWFVPWTFASGVSAIASGQDSSGVFQLLIAYGGKIMKAVAGSLVDDGVRFASRLRSNLFNMVPEGEPFAIGSVHHISAERNATAITSCSLLVDDNTTYSAGYAALDAAIDAPNLRTQGTLLKEDQFMCLGAAAAKAGRRCSVELNWSGGGWEFYSLDVNYRTIGGQK